VKSDEKASLAPRTAGERSPRSLTRNRQGRQTLFVPKNLLAANAKSHRKLQNVRKVRTVLCGGLEHQTRRKATVFAEHPPAQLTLLRSGGSVSGAKQPDPLASGS
jgi:hypothetical protein